MGKPQRAQDAEALTSQRMDQEQAQPQSFYSLGSLSFLLWALKNSSLSGTAASEPERSGCLIALPLPWGNPYKSAFLLQGLEQGLNGGRDVAQSL